MTPRDIDIAVFDLDGTLIREDSLFEQIRAVFCSSKIDFVYLISNLIFCGRVAFKRRAYYYSKRYSHRYDFLSNIRPNERVKMDFNIYKQRGTKIIVATASYKKTAIKVLSKIKAIPNVLIATDSKENLKGKAKLKVLLPYLANLKWAYYGDSKFDEPLFRSADFAFKVNDNLIEQINIQKNV